MAYLDDWAHGGFWWPGQLYTGNMISNNANLPLNATTVRQAMMFFVYRTGTITGVALRLGTVATGGTLTLQAETTTVNSNTPTGTLWGEGATASLVIGTGDANSMVLFTFATPITVARGDMLALVLYNDTVSPASLNFVRSNQGSIATRTPWFQAYTTSWGGLALQTPMFGALRYDVSGTPTYPYDPAFLPFVAATTNSVQVTQEVAVKFKLPFGGTLMEIVSLVTSNVPDNSVAWRLYDAVDNVLRELNYDHPPTSGNVTQQTHFSLPTPETLEAETWYRLGLRAISGSFGRGFPSGRLPSVDFASALPWGDRVCVSQRPWSGGAPSGTWTDTQTEIPPIFLRLGSIEYPSSGGGLRRSDWRGGFD